MQETWVRSLSWEDTLEKRMATHYSTLAWEIPWTEEPGRLQSMGVARVRHDWVTKPTNQRTRENLHPTRGLMSKCSRNNWWLSPTVTVPKVQDYRRLHWNSLCCYFLSRLKIFTWGQKTAGRTAIFPTVCTNQATGQQQQQHTRPQRAVTNGEKDGVV